MASIHWLAWITIGLVVIFTARNIGGNLVWFFWVGILFLLIGIAKAIHRFVFTPREKPAESKPQHAKPHAMRCPRCMTLAHPSDNYCRLCGTPLRKH